MASRLRAAVWIGAAALALPAAGCVSVKAPERIEIGNSSRPERVDSSRVPPTSSHEHARQELARAYENIRWLERENQRLERKAAEYKRERDDCREGREDDE